MRQPAARALVARAATLGLAVLVGCASAPPPPAPRPDPVEQPEIALEVYRRAETERAARLAREVEQLRADLQQAEEALVAAESGLRGSHTRADAISKLAGARIHVTRAANATPWRQDLIAEAQAKLDDADRQVAAGHFGAALFFVYRAERIAEALERESSAIYSTPGAGFIVGRRVNLRSGPSLDESVLSVLTRGTPVFTESRQLPWMLVRTVGGDVGWVHGSLVDVP